MGTITEITADIIENAEPLVNLALDSIPLGATGGQANPPAISDFVGRFNSLAVKTAKSTIEMCKVVYDAKIALKGGFAKFCEAIGRKEEDSTIRKYLAIGEAYPRFIDYADRMPNSWTSIYLITQIPSDKFNELVSQNRSLSNLTGPAIKNLIDGGSATKPESNPKSASALIFFKKEPTVPQWNYFKSVLAEVVDRCKDLELYSTTTPRYKRLIKDLKKQNREQAKAMRKMQRNAQKRLDERDIVYRPDLFDYGGSFDNEKGDFV